MIYTRKVMNGFEHGEVDKALKMPVCIRCKWCRLSGNNEVHGKTFVQGCCIRYAPRPDFATVNPTSTCCGEFEYSPFASFSVVAGNLPQDKWKEIYETGIDIDLRHPESLRCEKCNGNGDGEQYSFCTQCNGSGMNGSKPDIKETIISRTDKGIRIAYVLDGCSEPYYVDN